MVLTGGDYTRGAGFVDEGVARGQAVVRCAAMVGRRQVLLALSALTGGCSQRQHGDLGEGTEAFTLDGVGASQPAALYEEWSRQFHAVDDRVTVRYVPGSSSGAAEAVLKGSHFGASDAPFGADVLDRGLLQIPVALGSAAVVYNLPALKGGALALSGATVARIFLGEITSWDDAAIKKDNPERELPRAGIRVLVRGDSSGTTQLFSGFLAKRNQRWGSEIGATSSLSKLFSPSVTKMPSSDDLVKALQRTEGAVSFLSYSQVTQHRFKAAQIDNTAGRFVAPSLEATSTAATKADDLAASLVDMAGERTYPIVSFSYALCLASQPALPRSLKLLRFLWWATHDGQRFAPSLGFASLPSETVLKVEAQLRRAKIGGKPVNFGV